MSRWTMAALVVGLVAVAVRASPWLGSFLSGDAGPTRLDGPIVRTEETTGDLFGGTPTVEPEGLPSGAQPLPPGDYGLEVAQGGAIRGSWRAGDVGCENEGIIRVDTDRGSFLAGLAVPPGVSCEVVLAPWGRVAATSTMVGVRYTPGSDQGGRGLIIVNERGVSMTFAVGGAWRIP